VWGLSPRSSLAWLRVWDLLLAWLMGRSERWGPRAIGRLTVLYVAVCAAATAAFVALLMWRFA